MNTVTIDSSDDRSRDHDTWTDLLQAVLYDIGYHVNDNEWDESDEGVVRFHVSDEEAAAIEDVVNGRCAVRVVPD